MTSILSSVSAPQQADTLASHPSARSDAPDPDGAESFGAVLSRSLAPAAEAAGQADAKAATAAPGRRPPEGRKADPDELLNAMALPLPLVPLEHPLPKTALAAAGAAAAPSGDAIPNAANPAFTGLLPENTTAAQAAGRPVLAPAPDAATEASARPLTLAPELAAASPKDAGLPVAPARLQAAEASPAVALAPAGVAGASGASDSGAAGQRSQHRQEAGSLPQISADTTAGRGPEPDIERSIVKTPPPARMTPDATPASAGANGQLAVAELPAASVTPATSAAVDTAGMAAPAQAPAAMAASSAAPAVLTRSLTPEVGSSEWGKALGQQVIHMGKGGEQVAELQLNPPGLGPLKVTLSMNDHQVQAMFVSAHSSVRAAVEAALPQLRMTLADNGISLGNTSVNAESQQQTSFAQGQNGQSGQRPYRNDRVPDAAGAAGAATRPATEAVRQGRGISVDTYA
jgi:flagellar hook-length control protein FliK